MLIRPSLVIQIMLTPSDYSEATEKELKRSYISIAQSIVRQSDLDPDEGNVMRLSIRLMKPYWDMSDEKANELWDGVMPRWLQNITRNISTAAHNYNNVLHPIGVNNIHYDWIDYDFGNNALIRVKVDDENRITPSMPKYIEAIRAMLNSDEYDNEAIELIRIPSRQSYEHQLEAARAEQQDELSTESDATANALSEPDVEDTQAPDKTLTAGYSKDDMKNIGNGNSDEEVSDEVADQDSSDSEDETSKEEIKLHDLEYHIWGIEYKDGTVAEIDSREFL